MICRQQTPNKRLHTEQNITFMSGYVEITLFGEARPL